jgi:GST-like protein
MINLYTWPTPNSRKVSILLEEIDIPYKVFPIDITNDEQFSKEFSKISPSNKIPAIVDDENNKSIFETGAIMLYLSNKYNKFIPKDYYWDVMQWYFFQVSQVGPYLGQAHQFLSYHAGKSPYAEEKYKAYVKRVYNTLDERLKKNQYLGIEYSIADIATWPWVARFEIHKTNLEDYPNVLRWYRLIAKRSTVIRGFNAVGEKISIPMI